MFLLEVPFPYKIFIDTGVIYRSLYSEYHNKCHKQELECENYSFTELKRNVLRIGMISRSGKWKKRKLLTKSGQRQTTHKVVRRILSLQNINEI